MRYTNPTAMVLAAGFLLSLAAPGPASAASKTASSLSPWAVTRYTKHSPPPTPRLDDLPSLKSISQYGITWTLDQPVRVGRFVNGDFYVVGPATIVSIDPKPLWGAEVTNTIDKDSVRERNYAGQQARNGSMVNPSAKPKTGSFDSRTPSGRYDPKHFAHLPIRLVPGDSIVSTISRGNEEITKFGGQFVDPLRVAAVLICMNEPQPPDAFRPSFCDAKNSGLHLARNLRRDLLLALPPPLSAPSSLTKYVEAFRKPWVDIVEFGFAAPVENLPHYGQTMVELVGEGSLLLLMDYPAEEKESLLVNLVQVGIDFYGMARAGGSWPAHGGLHSGRKWPIVLAGILLDDADLQNPTRGWPHLHFAEDDQTALCPYEYKGKVFEKGWTGARAIFVGHTIESGGGDRGKWEMGRGPVDLLPPSEWPSLKKGGLPSSESYRRANTSAAWIGEALAVRLMHAEKIWNHDAFFAYVDRWMTENDAPFNVLIKEAGFTDMTMILYGRFTRQGYVTGAKFIPAMWRSYRDRLPPPADGHKDPPADATWR